MSLCFARPEKTASAGLLQLLLYLGEHGVLILEVLKDGLDLLLRANADLVILLGAGRGVPVEMVLREHDQRQEEQLDDIGNEKPKHEPRERIETVAHGTDGVPTEPDDRPGQDHPEKPDGADTLENPYRKTLGGRHALLVHDVDVTDGPLQFAQLREGLWNGSIFHTDKVRSPVYLAEPPAAIPKKKKPRACGAMLLSGDVADERREVLAHVDDLER